MSTETTKCCRKLTQTRSLDTKNAIIDAGIQLFAKSGFHSVNTKEIAKAAGCSIGSFYGYYEDKKHLFLDLVHIYKKDLMSAAVCQNSESKSDTAYTNEEVLNYFVGRKLSIAAKYPLAFHHELAHMQFRDPDVNAVFLYYYQMEIDTFEAHLSKHPECLRVTNYRVAAEIIYQLSDNMINAYLSAVGIATRDALISEYQQIISQYLFKKQA